MLSVAGQSWLSTGVSRRQMQSQECAGAVCVPSTLAGMPAPSAAGAVNKAWAADSQ